jgi:hypothetical protein
VSPEIRQTYVWCHHWSRERPFHVWSQS